MTLIELALQAGLRPKWAASTNGGEYHSGCPGCGGKDRFFIQPNHLNKKCMGRYACRQCGIKGDAIEFAIKYAHYSFKSALELFQGNLPTESWPTIDRQYRSDIQLRDLRVPGQQWKDAAKSFYLDCAGPLFPSSEVEFFQRRKLPYMVCNHIERWITDGSWGTEKPVWIPKGILIPTIDNNEIVRLKIRQSQPKDSSKRYVIISGSGNREYYVGDIRDAKHFIIMESELDVHSFQSFHIPNLFPIAMGSALANPTKELYEILSKAKTILICHDNDKAGRAMKYKWRKLYPKSVAYPTPIGKDIGEAIEMGLDIKKWLRPVWER